MIKDLFLLWLLSIIKHLCLMVLKIQYVKRLNGHEKIFNKSIYIEKLKWMDFLDEK